MAAHEDYSRSHAVDPSGNRAFGAVFAAVFAIVAAWPLLAGAGIRWWAAIVSAIFLLLALAAPSALAPLNRLWLRFGLLLNRIVSPVVLGFMFFAVVTPVAWLMRLAGKDNLRLRRDRTGGTYWVKRDPPGPDADSLRNQF